MQSTLARDLKAADGAQATDGRLVGRLSLEHLAELLRGWSRTPILEYRLPSSTRRSSCSGYSCTARSAATVASAEQAPPDEGLGRCPLQVPVVGSKPSSRLVLVNRVRELLCRLKSSRQLEMGPSVVRRGLHDLAPQGERARRVPAPGYERREATPILPEFRGSPLSVIARAEPMAASASAQSPFASYASASTTKASASFGASASA